jgi:hypothetical protein
VASGIVERVRNAGERINDRDGIRDANSVLDQPMRGSMDRWQPDSVARAVLRDNVGLA